MMFAAIAAAAALSPLRAQQVPARDLFHFPLGTLAEAPALASAAGGGFWNPASIALNGASRALVSASALHSTLEQGVAAQIGTGAYRTKRGFTVGLSFAEAHVADIPRTDTDPQSLGDVPFRSTIMSAVVAGERGPATVGLALRRRSGTVDVLEGSATSVDVGAVVDRPRGLPLRAAASTFLLSPSRDLERTSILAAVEGYLPVPGRDVRAGLSYQRDEGSGDESFLYASGRAGMLDLRGGFARQSSFGSSSTRLRLAAGVHYGHYVVGVSREDGTAGLGASYQFLLTTVIPMVAR